MSAGERAKPKECRSGRRRIVGGVRVHRSQSVAKFKNATFSKKKIFFGAKKTNFFKFFFKFSKIFFSFHSLEISIKISVF